LSADVQQGCGSQGRQQNWNEKRLAKPTGCIKPVATCSHARGAEPLAAALALVELFGCRRWVAVPLAPFIIRWGADASSDLLRKNPRCTKCGHRGGLLQMPSHHSLETPYQPFPTEHALRR
jgi:hypothetical protein